ncbi:MAG: Na-translocating system protein MpsB, partial [Prosthecobacter sp.]|nr:Na-translocating system protein MpsB [Prosthecobacter sp.]
AFIAAPRERTRHLNLQGRVFLHNYNHSADTTKSTLELIMTAPMVVANWINLQYYASMVNNRLWGSGNKVTHNVVGTFGIQQGNGGDLQAGLPLQSVHNGETWMHEPVRLSVLIEAPRSDIDAVIAKHESVRQLVENGWLHLFAIEEGNVILRKQPRVGWTMS